MHCILGNALAVHGEESEPVQPHTARPARFPPLLPSSPQEAPPDRSWAAAWRPESPAGASGACQTGQVSEIIRATHK